MTPESKSNCIMSEIMFPIMEGLLLSLDRLSSFQVNCSFCRHSINKIIIYILAVSLLQVLGMFQ